jgi:hypothetical protein
MRELDCGICCVNALCRERKRLPQQHKQIAALTSFMSELAGRFGGMYDGWETEIGNAR